MLSGIPPQNMVLVDIIQSQVGSGTHLKWEGIFILPKDFNEVPLSFVRIKIILVLEERQHDFSFDLRG